ncbi:MAG: hypothetical protein NXI32_26935 [bacterium]|nr:hypothetical protein [bacterium]
MVIAASGAELSEPPETEEKIDWNAVRAMALDCLDSTLDLQSWAERSQQADYDAVSASLHLATIDKARDISCRSWLILPMGIDGCTSDSLRQAPVFDQLAQASVGEGARPDFGFSATAHEKVFELLMRALLRIENNLGDELAIEDLHRFSPEQLRETLYQLEKKDPIRNVLGGSVRLYNLRGWINREWAAVSAIHSPTRSKVKTPQGQVKTTRATPNKDFDSAILEIVRELFPRGQRRKTKTIVLHIYRKCQSETENPAKHVENAYSTLWPNEIDDEPKGTLLDSACEKIRASLNRIDAHTSKKRSCQRR